MRQRFSPYERLSMMIYIMASSVAMKILDKNVGALEPNHLCTNLLN